MNAWTSPRDGAIADLKRLHRFSPDDASGAVEIVFGRLGDPDRDMLAAGVAELERALPPKTGRAYLRALAGVIWRAMLERAR